MAEWWVWQRKPTGRAGERKQIMRSKIDECNLWQSAAEQNITKESRMIYVCVKFSCTRRSSRREKKNQLISLLPPKHNESNLSREKKKKTTTNNKNSNIEMEIFWEATTTTKKWDKGSDDHLSRLCVILPFYAFISHTQCSAGSAKNSFSSKSISLDIIEFRCRYLPLRAADAAASQYTQNRLQPIPINDWGNERIIQ